MNSKTKNRQNSNNMTYESAVECLNEVKIEFEKLIEQNNLLDQSRNNAKEDLKFTKDDLKSTNESATKQKKQIDNIFNQNMNVEKLYQLKNELDEKNIKIAEQVLKIEKLSN